MTFLKGFLKTAAMVKLAPKKRKPGAGMIDGGTAAIDSKSYIGKEGPNNDSDE